MDNTTENKLVIASGSDSGKEYPLSQGRTTIGSAPDNDVRFKDPGISGFHAEVRCENNCFYICDFNSEKGTFVNEARINQEKQLSAGDRIQMGSVHAVFMPGNGIIAREYNPGISLKKVRERIDPYFQKWMNKKNRKIMACVLPMIVVLMIAMALSGNPRTDPKGSAKQHAKTIHSSQADDIGNGPKKKRTDPSQNTPPASEHGSPDSAANGAPAASTGTGRNQTEPRPQDDFANIYFNIAANFADHQLWQNALEYYYRVYEKTPSHPELSDHIAKMKVEINNQTIFEEAQVLIEKEHYEEGIANLRRIPETSYYFPKATQFIADAEKNLMQAKKENEDNQRGDQLSNPAENR